MSMTDLPTNGKQDKQSANSAIPQPPPITALNANLKQPDDSNTTANTQSVRKRLFLGTENPFGRGTAANNTQEGIKSSYSLPSLSMPPSSAFLIVKII